MSDLQFPDLNGFSLHVTVHIAPENLEAFYAAMTPVFDAVAAEPECLYFELYQDPTSPGTISWVENWDATTQWFKDVRMQKDYYKPYFEATIPMYIKDRQFRILKRLGPRYVVQKEANLK